MYHVEDSPGLVLLHSKDRITAGDGERAHDMKGKAEISTTTAAAIFELLENAGKESPSYVTQMLSSIFIL